MIAIFDIGANNGLNGLAFAILNPNTKVFSFEPNPVLRKTILKNKKIFEKKLGINLKNPTNEHEISKCSTNYAPTIHPCIPGPIIN